MKITKTQLRKIIKEEVSRILNEYNFDPLFEKSLWGGPTDGQAGTPSGTYKGLEGEYKAAKASGNSAAAQSFENEIKALGATQVNKNIHAHGRPVQSFPPRYDQVEGK